MSSLQLLYLQQNSSSVTHRYSFPPSTSSEFFKIKITTPICFPDLHTVSCTHRTSQCFFPQIFFCETAQCHHACPPPPYFRSCSAANKYILVQITILLPFCKHNVIEYGPLTNLTQPDDLQISGQ